MRAAAVIFFSVICLVCSVVAVANVLHERFDRATLLTVLALDASRRAREEAKR